MKNKILHALVAGAISFVGLGLAYGAGTSSGAGFGYFPSDDQMPELDIRAEYIDSELGVKISEEIRKTYADQGISITEDIGLHDYDSVCGFAGCDTSYIINHTITPQTVNAQSISYMILAYVPQFGAGTFFAELSIESKENEEVVPVNGIATNETVADAFAASDMVAKFKEKVMSAFPNAEVKGVQVSTLGVSCGFAGCSNSYFLSLSVKTLSAGESEVVFTAVATDLLRGKNVRIQEVSFISDEIEMN